MATACLMSTPISMATPSGRNGSNSSATANALLATAALTAASGPKSARRSRPEPPARSTQECLPTATARSSRTSVSNHRPALLLFAAVYEHHHGLDLANFVFRAGEIIAVDHHQISLFPGLDR